jgi:cell division protein FtsW (lipid II flippase)
VAGIIAGKTGRWIPIFGLFNLQPSQLAIPVVALLLTKLHQSMSFNSWKNIGKLAIIIGIPAILIFIAPDLGTTVVYVLSCSAIIFLSDISWKKILSIFSIATIATVFAWFFIFHDYQKQRIISFVNPEAHSSGASYNARQALIAAGSGRLFGRGLGQGVQSHLRFLPERQTDFIFASFAEEFGFQGAAFMLLLYVLLIAHILIVAKKSSSLSTHMYCVAIAVMTIVQAGVNIGMNIGIMPITGITLPLVSYGGSSVLSLCLMYGIVQSIAYQIQPKSALHLA